MAKFFGNIGYGVPTEIRPGYWKDDVVARPYYGDIIQESRILQSSDQVNDNIVIANKISILSDPFANENFHAMKYVEYMGTRWKVTKVEVNYPRLILTFGGVYNGDVE